MELRYKGGKVINLRSIWNFLQAMWRKYFQSNSEQRAQVAAFDPTKVQEIEVDPDSDYADLLPYTTLHDLGVEQKEVLLKQLQDLEKSGIDELVRVPLLRTALVQAKSPECIKAGHCTHCKCPIPSKFYETEGCEEGCYKEWPR